MVDFQSYIVQRDTEKRIKETRDNMLVQVVDLHMEKLSSEIRNTEQRLNLRIDGLDKRIDDVEKNLGHRIDGLDKRIDGLSQEIKDVNHRMDRHLEQTLSIKKWVIGLVISVLLGIIVAVFPMINVALSGG